MQNQTSDLHVPSGFEVESAHIHVPEDHLLTDHTHDGGMKDRMFHVKSAMRTRMMTIHEGMSAHVDSMQSSVRSRATMWAGIAAGAGLGLGILGRIMRRRARAMHIPHVVIIEGSC